MNVYLLQIQASWANQTRLHWLALVLTSFLTLWALVLPRRWVPMTLLALACFIPQGQRVVVLTLDFSLLRVLVLFVWVRIAVRGEYAGLRLNWIDGVLVSWTCVGLLAYSLLHGTPEALIFKLGQAFDAIGLYFLFRCFVREWLDCEYVALSLALLAIPVCAAFLVERFTGRNMFSLFGGVAEITEVREGRLRCQGAFAHPILAGCYWAVALPLMAGCWWGRSGARLVGVIGLLCGVVIIGLTASSTPVMAGLCAGLGGVSFLFRRYMRAGRIVLLAGIVALHFLMKAPVWQLIARVNVVDGSTGWHRFMLVDQTIHRFEEWWLIGALGTERWGRGLSDVTNQYVLEALNGGLMGLVLFMSLIALGFRAVGRSWRAAWPERRSVAVAWALGVSLFTLCVSFIGVSYFDQTGLLWYLILASIAGLGGAGAGTGRLPARASWQPVEGALASGTGARFPGTGASFPGIGGGADG